MFKNDAKEFLTGDLFRQYRLRCIINILVLILEIFMKLVSFLFFSLFDGLSILAKKRVRMYVDFSSPILPFIKNSTLRFDSMPI